MKILIDASGLGVGRLSPLGQTGIFRHSLHLVEYLIARRDIELSLCASYSADIVQASYAVCRDRGWLGRAPFRRSRRLDLARPLRKAENRMARRPPGWLGKPLAAGLRAAFRALEAGAPLLSARAVAAAQVFHSPVLGFPELTEQPARAGRLRRFLTVHDLIPIRFPEIHTDHMSRVMAAALAGLTERDWVFCDSDATRADLLDYRKGLDPERVLVNYLAAGPQFAPCADSGRVRAVAKAHGIPEAPYFLSVATVEPRKNLRTVIDAFRAFCADAAGADASLVLVGASGWKVEGAFDDVRRDPVLSGRVVFTGFVDDADLAPLYSGALGFVYMSLYEGFGLPPLEAMQCGVPAVVSNTSSLPEVVGDAAIRLDPRDADGLAGAMRRLASDPDLRARMRAQSLERARSFSWDRFGDRTVAAYERALGAGR